MRRRTMRNPPKDAREARLESRCTEKRGQQSIVIMFVVQIAVRFMWQWRAFI